MNLIHLLSFACADRLGKKGCGGRLLHVYRSLVRWVVARRAIEAFVNSIVVVPAEADVTGFTKGFIGIIF